jgi:hypothetical protein
MIDLVDSYDVQGKSRSKIDFTNMECCRCGNRDLISGSTYREYDTNGNFTGRWLCKSCYTQDYNRRPDSHAGLLRLMSKWRNKELSRYCTSGKAFIGEQIWCKARGVENCNIKEEV